MKSVELFVGAGGLAKGAHAAGFKHVAALDWNRDACETLRLNQAAGVAWLQGVGIHQADVTSFDFSAFGSDVDLLAGGPPCQPFSVGGRHQGHLDERDMFPHFIRAMRELRPRAILVENVQGLARKKFAEYLDYIQLRMSHPGLVRRENEDWQEHLGRLKDFSVAGESDGLTYRVSARVLNAADFGVPQRRQRIFFVGFRSDLDVEWAFPEPTHSQDALLWDKWVSGAYWERHGLRRPPPPSRGAKSLERLQSSLFPPPTQPWLTVRDAISDLPDPKSIEAASVPNHTFQPGARSYPGHTGSPLDEPAKTLKAGVHGVPGGENMIAFEDGSVRYFTPREAARIQTFPDDYVLTGAWSEVMRQLGNAVPVRLATVLAEGIRARLVQALEFAEDFA